MASTSAMEPGSAASSTAGVFGTATAGSDNPIRRQHHAQRQQVHVRSHGLLSDRWSAIKFIGRSSGGAYGVAGD